MSWIGGDDVHHWMNVVWERINFLRPPPSVDFSWRSTWPIPLYGLACVAHRRVRACKPRRLPTLTIITVPEIYGIFALGHVAHLEANRLSKKAAEMRGLDLIQNVADWARCEHRKYPERFTTPTGFKEGLDYTFFFLKNQLDEFHLWRFKLRCSWASEQSRKLASCLVARRVALLAPDTISYHDVALLTLFISEELDRNSHGIFRPSFLRDNALMRDLASLALSSLVARWGSASKGVLRTNALLQRYFVCLLAFKWLGGRYCHYASMFGFEKADTVGFLVGLARMDWMIKHGEWVAEADPAATFAEMGLSVPPWFGD